MNSTERSSGNPHRVKQSVLVVFIKNSKMECYEFSSLFLAKEFTRDLNPKEFVVVIGNLATDALKSM